MKVLIAIRKYFLQPCAKTWLFKQCKKQKSSYHNVTSLYQKDMWHTKATYSYTYLSSRTRYRCVNEFSRTVSFILRVEYAIVIKASYLWTPQAKRIMKLLQVLITLPEQWILAASAWFCHSVKVECLITHSAGGLIWKSKQVVFT